MSMQTSKSNIKEITGGNIFCGPAVLTAITGIPTNEIAELINEIRHRPYYAEVKGAYIEELLQVLTRIGGYKTTKIPFVENSSVFFTLTSIRLDGFYILTLPSHFVLVEKQGGDRFIVDNGLKTPMRAEGSARLDQKVLQCYFVEKVGEHTYKKYEFPPAPILQPKPSIERINRLDLAIGFLQRYIQKHNDSALVEYAIERCTCELCEEVRRFLENQ
jgi:hypothetical protein